MNKIEEIEIIPDMTAPRPFGFVRSSLGWMPPKRDVIERINEVIRAVNKINS